MGNKGDDILLHTTTTTSVTENGNISGELGVAGFFLPKGIQEIISFFGIMAIAQNSSQL